MYGERGGPEMARRLGIPVRTWYNYEKGITIPAEIILKVIRLTQVEAAWLLDGTGPMFADQRGDDALSGEPTAPSDKVIGTLLRTALHLLENQQSTKPPPAGTSALPEPGYRSRPAVAAPAALENQIMVREGRWSDKTVRMRAGIDRSSRRRHA
jgi:hypothetical protein